MSAGANLIIAISLFFIIPLLVVLPPLGLALLIGLFFVLRAMRSSEKRSQAAARLAHRQTWGY
jgi:hypothetical protein